MLTHTPPQFPATSDALPTRLLKRTVPEHIRGWAMLCYLTLGIFGVLFSASVYQRADTVVESTLALVNEDIPDQRIISSLKTNIVALEPALYEYYATEDSAAFTRDIGLKRAAINHEFAALKKRFPEDARLLTLQQQLTQIADWARSLDRNLSSRETDWDTARQTLVQISAAATAANAVLDELLRELQVAVTARSVEVQQRVGQITSITFACSLLLFACAVFMGRGVVQLLADGWHQRWLAHFPERNPVLTISLSPRGEVLYANPSAENLLGVQVSPTPGSHTARATNLLSALQPLLAVRAACQEFEHQSDQTLFACRLHFLPDLEIYHLYLSDITERRRAEAELSHAAFHDALTGLANRRALLVHLDRRLISKSQQPLTLALLDIQRFSAVVERLGREGADATLNVVAERLLTITEHYRLEGVALDLYRLEGDTFCLLIDHVELTARDSIFDRIVGLFAQPIVIKGQELFLNVSVGIAAYNGSGIDAARLLHRADLARQQAKRDESHAVQSFDLHLENEIQKRQEIESALYRALENQELRLVYQAQQDIGTGRIIGSEALLRWQHPVLGAISPAVFIPIAELSGFMVSLGWWVIEQACTQWRDWACAGLSPGTVAVNVSARQLIEPDFSARLARTLSAKGVPAAHLEIEITESAAMRNAEDSIQTLAEIRALGCRVAIDDFGTGYSSFSYLNRFALNILKIDQSFVKPIVHSAREYTLVQAMIEMAHKLDLKVVAEGVETAEHLEILKQLGCDVAQGYFISRPSEAEAFQALLAGTTIGPTTTAVQPGALPLARNIEIAQAVSVRTSRQCA